LNRLLVAFVVKPLACTTAARSTFCCNGDRRSHTERVEHAVKRSTFTQHRTNQTFVRPGEDVTNMSLLLHDSS